ncbi:polyphosphate kinase 2 family protein [uncultured Gulosibacter sp.]|uniref:polyphosphate kinase 2 family protein n=1 Tax=uncultured Gulosibacter sp. TaxID=1339167 RepID=UPI002889EDA7|nr:polyphosphate kinase 2 family protein [uncultured Gulosibacter sp.]
MDVPVDLSQLGQLEVRAGFCLADIDPDSTPGFTGTNAKLEGQQLFSARDAEMADLQERMYARARAGLADAPSLLVVLQGMDAAGKGGIVRHVFGSVDPQGLQIASFKAPTEEELQHDFLWRIRKQLPKPGRIGVFDRSHYEDVLVQRVHQYAPADEIDRRYGAIVKFERELVDSGTRVLKFMLHIDRDEQAKRLLERIDRPDKHWKYNPGDIDDRARWDDYAEAYQIALERTSTPVAPWYVIPANKKWYARLAVKSIVQNELRRIDPQWPEASFDQQIERERLAQS